MQICANKLKPFHTQKKLYIQSTGYPKFDPPHANQPIFSLLFAKLAITKFARELS